MKTHSLLFSALMGAVASARSMTPMAAIAAARLAGRQTPGRLLLLDRPAFRFGALAMGLGELFGDKLRTAPDRTVFLGLLARVVSAGIAGAALAPRHREPSGAAIAVAAAVPLAYLTLSVRRWAMARIGQTRSGLLEDALVLAAGAAAVALATEPGHVGSLRSGARSGNSQPVRSGDRAERDRPTWRSLSNRSCPTPGRAADARVPAPVVHNVTR